MSIIIVSINTTVLSSLESFLDPGAPTAADMKRLLCPIKQSLHQHTQSLHQQLEIKIFPAVGSATPKRSSTFKKVHLLGVNINVVLPKQVDINIVLSEL